MEATPAHQPLTNYLMLNDDRMALSLYDDTIKVWSTDRGQVAHWDEVGQQPAEVLKQHPTIQSGRDANLNHLNMGPESLRNFRREVWADENGSLRPVSSPLVLTNSLDEEVKRLEAAYINLPCDEDEEGLQPPHTPLTQISDTGTTPPLSPCSPFLSPDSLVSPFSFPASPGDPFRYNFPLSLSGRSTISPCEVFSPLPQDNFISDTFMDETQAPSTPVVPIQSLPDVCLDVPLPPSPNPLPSCPPSPPIAGPSRSTSKRLRWSDDDSDDGSDEFTPARKTSRSGKRAKVGSSKRTGATPGGKGAKCDLCGKPLGRATDLPRHRASCKENPKREVRKTPCEFCGKLLPVRSDAVKRHMASKTCLSKRKDDDEDPYLSES